MKTYQIEFQSTISEGVNELTNYLFNRIKNIEKDFSIVEKCEVELHKDNRDINDCEVVLRLFVPRHVYVARDKEKNFTHAAETVFDELHKQLNELKAHMMCK